MTEQDINSVILALGIARGLISRLADHLEQSDKESVGTIDFIITKSIYKDEVKS